MPTHTFQLEECRREYYRRITIEYVQVLRSIKNLVRWCLDKLLADQQKFSFGVIKHVLRQRSYACLYCPILETALESLLVGPFLAAAAATATDAFASFLFCIFVWQQLAV